jgi:hypothetical protein
VSPWNETSNRYAQLARDRRERRATVLENLSLELDSTLQEELTAAQIIAEEIRDTSHEPTHLTPR